AKVRKITDANASEETEYEARPIKKIGSAALRRIGIFRSRPTGGGTIEAIDKRASTDWIVLDSDAADASDGVLVEAVETGAKLHGLPKGRVITVFGDPSAPRAVSLISIVQHDLPLEFPEDVVAEATEAMPVEDLGTREDLRHLPLVTIDPSDARDHDDAVCALKDPDPGNPDGHILWVAIADVAHHVRPGTALDAEARKRGNSTYFPDRVVPMLPEALSGDLCSLHQDVDRPCLAVEIVLDARGEKQRHRFCRGLMRSPAALAYEQAQDMMDRGANSPCLTDDPSLGSPQWGTTPFSLDTLRAAYAAAAQARARRQPLDLELPERTVVLGEDGSVVSVDFKERLEAHRLIEEFMILANVCAAETLETAGAPLLYRVHEEPNPEKLDALRETVSSIGLSLAKGQVLQTRHLNHLLEAARESESAETVSMAVLRAQTQAYYSPKNYGHFGLNLKRYAHFTSPIRRYADLVVHRALIATLDRGNAAGALADGDWLGKTADHISQTERRSMDAERDTTDRYLAAYLSDREGSEFSGHISGVSRAGAFVKLHETGADGLIPIGQLGGEYLELDRDTNTLTGRTTGRVFGLGLRVTVRLVEAVPVTGGLILELISVDGETIRTARRRGGTGASGRRQLTKDRLQRAKAARRARRRR
ncbi:MAG: VacB/RNase II family 3'-5' exoribonuclease, partial [Pseudomonadota bacterium]